MSRAPVAPTLDLRVCAALLVAATALGMHPGQAAGQASEVRSGTLAPGDALLDFEDERWHDRYFFEAQAGETVTVELASDDFDAWLRVILPSGEELVNDDGSDGTDSKLTFLAPEASTYTVIAAAYGSGATGSYELSWTARPVDDFQQFTGRLAALSPKGQPYDSVDVVVEAGRVLLQASNPSGVYLALMAVSPDGTRVPGRSEGATATLETYARAAGTWRVFLVGDEGMEGAPYTLGMALTRDGEMEVIQGELAKGDDRLPLGEYVDVHRIRVDEPGAVSIEVTSDELDTYLVVETAGALPLVERNDDAPGASGMLSRVEFDADDVRGRTGEWTIWVTSFSPGDTGSYEVRIVRRE